MPQVSNTCFAYVDENKVLSGLLLYYRKDDPTRWLIGLIKNTNLPPEQRQVFVLTSFNPKSLSQSACDITAVAAADNALIKALASPLLVKFIRQILTHPRGS